ncbi:MAG: hypothetical protein ABI359_01680 [Ginsengibacter sp.]
MKLISFFSKFTFICNLCFLLFVFFNRIDAKKHISGASGTVIAFPFFKDLIIILGFSAIIINLAMCIVYLVNILRKKTFLLPKWLAITNFIFLIVQFYFFFL